MKITCALSGIVYSVDYFNIRLKEGMTYHPIFDLPQSELHPFYSAFCKQELKAEETYLLTLALLKTTDLILFQHSAKFSQDSTSQHSILISSLTRLYRIVSLIQAISVPHLSFPKLAINEDTAALHDLPAWLNTWENCYNDFLTGLSESQDRDTLKRKERALEKFIKTPNIPAKKYAHVLAEWSTHAFQFPAYIVDYWQEIIVKCYNYDDIVKIPLVDMNELIEHCEDNLGDANIGTLQCTLLLSTLREGEDKIRSEQVMSKNAEGFVILDSERKDHAHIIEVLKAAPEIEPILANYPNRLEFQRALLRWRLASQINTSEVKMKNQGSNQDSNQGEDNGI